MTGINILLVGDRGAGKTTWIKHVSQNFPTKISNDLIYTVNVYGKDINVWDICDSNAYWDFMSNESNRTKQYFDAHGVIVMYEAQNDTSLRNAHKWYAEIQHASPGKHVLFVANKWDGVGTLQFRCDELSRYPYAAWFRMSLKHKIGSPTASIEWFIPHILHWFQY
jgi:GTPase SAR1 family protein